MRRHEPATAAPAIDRASQISLGPWDSVGSQSDQKVSAVQRYFEISLFLLVSTGILAVISTGKLDFFSTVVPPALLLYKGIRLWRGRGPELSQQVATWLVLAYFLFFPLDLSFFSRNFASTAPNPGLYAGLLAAVHLLLFAALVRLFSARAGRDYIFLAVLAFTAMLASAILTVDTTFLISLAIFLVVAVSTFVGFEIRRAAEGALSPPLEWGTPTARQLQRALGVTSVAVAIGALVLGVGLFFLIPRFTAGYLSALNLQPTLMTGFSDDVSLGEIGEIKKSSAVVMRVEITGNSQPPVDLRWRGVALTNFDGRRWFTSEPDSIIVSPAPDGVYRLPVTPLPFPETDRMHYVVMLEPVATDAVFLAPRATNVRGHFSPERERIGAPNREYLLMDQIRSITWRRCGMKRPPWFPTYLPACYGPLLRTIPTQFVRRICNFRNWTLEFRRSRAKLQKERRLCTTRRRGWKRIFTPILDTRWTFQVSLPLPTRCHISCS
jgi:hypothetical protein